MPGLKNNIFRIIYFGFKNKEGPSSGSATVSIYQSVRNNLKEKANQNVGPGANTTVRPVSNVVLLLC